MNLKKKIRSRAIRLLHLWVLTPNNLRKNREKKNRRLEIGPGDNRLPGFETLNIVANRVTDYVCDANGSLPFEDNTFEVIYGSHVFEHIPWYRGPEVLKEWVRILKPGGSLELWVPDGLKICKAWVAAEESGDDSWAEHDPWFRFNEQKDPCRWASGRIFTYGDGSGSTCHPNWHFSVFSERYFKKLFSDAGLINVERMAPSEVRGYDHGWINLGMRGIKP